MLRVTALESRLVPSGTTAPVDPVAAADPTAGDGDPVLIGTNAGGEAIYTFEAAPGRCGCAMCGGRVSMVLAPSVAEPSPTETVVAAVSAEEVVPVPVVTAPPPAPAVPVSPPPSIAAASLTAPTTSAVTTPSASVPSGPGSPDHLDTRLAVFAAQDFDQESEPDRVVTSPTSVELDEPGFAAWPAAFDELWIESVPHDLA